jgi:hypothetical protein
MYIYIRRDEIKYSMKSSPRRLRRPHKYLEAEYRTGLIVDAGKQLLSKSYDHPCRALGMEINCRYSVAVTPAIYLKFT